jgi:hypothetical protein
VWSNSFSAVWNLKEQGNGTLDEYLDSTGNSNDGQGGAGTGSAVPTRVSSVINYTQSFDGGDFISMGNVLSHGYSSTLTYSAWIKTTGNDMQIMGKANNLTDRGVWFYITPNGALGFYLYSYFLILTYEKSKWCSPYVNDGKWHLVHATYSGNSNPSGMNLYLDGELMTVDGTVNDATTGTVENTQPFNIGSVQNGAGYNYTGSIGHSRVASVVRSADWIRTESNNQSSPETFYGVELWQ